jgi:NTE family protein
VKTTTTSKPRTIDLIMEGGGVKGVGLVGALGALDRQGFRFRRVAGTSAGAVTASLVAAGMPSGQLTKTVRSVPFGAFQDEGFLDHLGPIGKGLSIIFEKGIYEGDFLHHWLTEQLAALNVRTFSDLKLEGPFANTLPPEHRYKLVVLTTDVSRGKLVRLPWDYHEYGLDADTQLVADAVRASASIPFFYEPVKLAGDYLVDGGIISNFPIWIFEPSRHEHNIETPTIGIKLSARPEANMLPKIKNTSNTLNFAVSVLSSMISSQDQIHLDDPCTIRRTIFVDTGDIGTTEFDLSDQQKDFLYQNGQAATEKFLKDWDFKRFLTQCDH